MNTVTGSTILGAYCVIYFDEWSKKFNYCRTYLSDNLFSFFPRIFPNSIKSAKL